MIAVYPIGQPIQLAKVELQPGSQITCLLERRESLRNFFRDSLSATFHTGTRKANLAPTKLANIEVKGVGRRPVLRATANASLAIPRGNPADESVNKVIQLKLGTKIRNRIVKCQRAFVKHLTQNGKSQIWHGGGSCNIQLIIYRFESVT